MSSVSGARATRSVASAAGALLAAVSVLAAPGAAATTATPSPPQTVRSNDNGLVLSVPRGALRTPTKIRIRVLTRSQYPPELRDVTFKRGSRLYALEPAGLRFLKPVRITRRIDAKAQGFDLSAAVPGIVLTTRSANGRWEILDRQAVRAQGSTLVVSATTRHFSTVVAFDGGVRLTMVPASLESVVGATWDAKVVAEIDNSRRSDPVSLERANWLEPKGNVARAGGPGGVYGARFTCTAPGTGYWAADAVVGIESLAIRLASGDIFSSEPPFTQEFRVYGTVDCRAKPPTTAELALACVVVAHTPLGSSPSFLRWLLSFRGVPAGARAELTVAGMNGGQPVSGTTDASGRVEVRGGITSYGGKQVQKLTVGGQDLTQQLVAKTGSSVNVTAAQGTAAGQCP